MSPFLKKKNKRREQLSIAALGHKTDFCFGRSFFGGGRAREEEEMRPEKWDSSKSIYITPRKYLKKRRRRRR
jgi:hypothetical protein